MKLNHDIQMGSSALWHEFKFKHYPCGTNSSSNTTLTGLQAGFRDLSYQDTDKEPKPELPGLFPDKKGAL